MYSIAFNQHNYVKPSSQPVMDRKPPFEIQLLQNLLQSHALKYMHSINGSNLKYFKNEANSFVRVQIEVSQDIFSNRCVYLPQYKVEISRVNISYTGASTATNQPEVRVLVMM